MTAAQKHEASTPLLAPAVMDDSANGKRSAKRARDIPLKHRLEAARQLVFYMDKIGQADTYDGVSLWWPRMIGLLPSLMPGLKPTYCCVLSRIAARVNPKSGEAYPSHFQIEAETDIGDDTITAAINFAEAEGLLLVKRRSRKSSIYRLALPKAVVLAARKQLSELQVKASDDPEIFRDHEEASEVVQPRKKRRMNPKISVDDPEIFREELNNSNRTNEGIGLTANASSVIDEKSRVRALEARDADRPDEASDPYRPIGKISDHLKAIKRALDFNISRSDAEGLLKTLPRGEAIDRAYDAAHEHEANNERRDQVERLLSSVGFLIDRFSDEPWQRLCRALGHKIEGDDD